MDKVVAPPPRRALPLPTPETQDFWDGCRAGELRLQRCDACGHAFFPPGPVCPQCGSREVATFRASGRATLYSYVINMRPRPDMDLRLPVEGHRGRAVAPCLRRL